MNLENVERKKNHKKFELLKDRSFLDERKKAFFIIFEMPCFGKIVDTSSK